MSLALAKKHRRNDLAPAVWQEYVKTLLVRSEGEEVRVNGCSLTGTQTRALYRWLQEGTAPSVFSADAFLISVGLHLDDLFLWIEEHKLQAWACGLPPDWWAQEEEEVDRRASAA